MAKVTKRKIETGTSDKVAPKSGPRQPVKKITRDEEDGGSLYDELLDEDDGETYRGKAKPQPVKSSAEKDAEAKSGDGTSGDAKSARDKKSGVRKVDTGKKDKPSSKHTSKRVTPAASTRYTPPTVRYEEMPSPMWVPILMFTLFALGMLTIFLNYVAVLLPGATSNWYLLLGLGFILGGIITATQFR